MIAFLLMRLAVCEIADLLDIKVFPEWVGGHPVTITTIAPEGRGYKLSDTLRCSRDEQTSSTVKH